MGSPISPIVANLYIEDFEMRAINTSPQPPFMWKKLVDDTCVIIKAAQKVSFLNHINSIDQNIQFTAEEPSVKVQTRDVYVGYILILCYCYRQLRFSLYSGAFITRTQFCSQYLY